MEQFVMRSYLKITFTIAAVCILHMVQAQVVDADLPLRGITLVAPPDPIEITEMEALADANAEWVALIPFGFSRMGDPTIRYEQGNQWWGEKADGLITCIQLAHKKGLKVMLKPQIYIHQNWIGDVDFDTEEEWLTWEKNYKKFISFFMQIAIDQGADLFCVGTECKIAAQKRPDFWIGMIREFKEKYKGTIIYSSNWDGFELVSFWDELDFIGISSYFPLSELTTPSVNQLNVAWRPIKKQLKAVSKKYDKKIIFTEYGYLSVDGCAGRAWLIEKDIPNRAINEKAQANAYHALLAAHWNEDYWGGGFLWKWFPADLGHEGYIEKDYTPQRKLSLDVIKYWYGK